MLLCYLPIMISVDRRSARREFVLLSAISASLAGWIGCGGASTPAGRVTAPARSTRGDAVASHVRPYVDHQLIDALVVGMLVDGKAEFWGFGRGQPDADSLFEIGSVSKVYTAMLAAAVVRGEAAVLDVPVVQWLPPGVTVPEKNGVAISLRHLLGHSSALPRLPASLDASAADPYARYAAADMYRDLQNTELDDTPGATVAYSNLGYGLLGHALALHEKASFATVLGKYVLSPMGLTHTFVREPDSLRGKVVAGRNSDLQPVPRWQWDVLAPAGALVSSARDQIAMLRWQLAAAKPIHEVKQHVPWLPATHAAIGDDPQLAWAWHIDRRGRYWHNGATGGYHAFVGFDPQKQTAVVVLAATQSSLVDKLAASLLAVAAGEPVPPVQLPTVAAMATYVGAYTFAELGPAGAVRVWLDHGRLYTGAANEPPVRLIPLPQAGWFLIEELGASVGFSIGNEGQMMMELQVGSQVLRATRAAAPAAAPVGSSSP